MALDAKDQSWKANEEPNSPRSLVSEASSYENEKRSSVLTLDPRNNDRVYLTGWRLQLMSLRSVYYGREC